MCSKVGSILKKNGLQGWALWKGWKRSQVTQAVFISSLIFLCLPCFLAAPTWMPRPMTTWSWTVIPQTSQQPLSAFPPLLPTHQMRANPLHPEALVDPYAIPASLPPTYFTRLSRSPPCKRRLGWGRGAYPYSFLYPVSLLAVWVLLISWGWALLYEPPNPPFRCKLEEIQRGVAQFFL